MWRRSTAARTTSALPAAVRPSRRTLDRSSRPGERLATVDDAERLRERAREDEKLLRRTEKALTEIKVAQGLSEPHASVLAALRIRLKGDAGGSLEDLLTAAGDLGRPG